MNVTIDGYLFHKDAEGFEDCFDRYAINLVNNKFAVSDGVSKSFFPGIWADLIVNSFVENPSRADLVDAELLQQIQKKWSNLVSEIVHRPNQKYYVRNFFAQGRSAAATFVGLHFFQENGLCQWEAFALGDSFLFFIPQSVENIDQQFERVIILSSKKDLQFDNFPDHFDSNNLSNKGKIKKTRHNLTPGTFLLMTDALSEWFIAEKGVALREIRSWKNQSIFEQRITELRKSKLTNDDAAILFLEVKDDHRTEIRYSRINVSELDFLHEPVGITTTSLTHFDQMVDEISEKFHQAPILEETSHKHLPIKKVVVGDDIAGDNVKKRIEASVNEKSDLDYLARRKHVKKKKRSLLQRAIDEISNLFGAKTQYISEVEEKNEDVQKNKHQQDINDITDKF